MQTKYNIELLEWQQFEVLAFKCLQFDVSPSVQFIEGGNDKGRDIIYKGITHFFDTDGLERNYVFQVKHKSKLDSFSALKQDLKTELVKVFVTNNLAYDRYCLVTNLQLSGDQVDELNEVFNSFKTDHENLSVTLAIYSYRHLESCIDNHSEIKWCFPRIITAADFKHLLEQVLNASAMAVSEAWIRSFERNRERFIYTNIFNLALDKLKENKILLLSGPPKSGKTFTAEMILLSKLTESGFIPYKIDTPDEFTRVYNKNQKQIFLFDDAFGRHDIELYRADIFNRKLELIFQLIDEDHHCIFTSREYIFKAFSNYADENIEKLITKINVEVSQLSLIEKESLLRRYFEITFPGIFGSYQMYLQYIITHKNFSPETIRSYFESVTSFNYNEFKNHLELPDRYLETVFTNLSEVRRIALLAILLSSKSDTDTIAYAFKNICNDLNKQFLVALKGELDQMDGSIIRANQNKFDFYHPSMKDFFIKFLGKDVAIYRGLLFKNMNIDILSVCKFTVGKYENKLLALQESDISNLKIGIERLILNRHISIFELNTLFYWFNDMDIQLHLKLKLKSDYTDIIKSMFSALKNVHNTNFLKEGIALVSDYLHNIRSFLSVTPKDDLLPETFLNTLINKNKQDPDFWMLVFRIAPLTNEEYIQREIGRDWLNSFYTDLKNEIDFLGNELYGESYPHFPEVKRYKELMAEKNHIEAAKITKKSRGDYMLKTRNDWYPRYKICKDKMNVLKTSPVFGHKIYQLLLENFSQLTALEEKQKNRYFFLVKKEWWNNLTQ